MGELRADGLLLPFARKQAGIAEGAIAPALNDASSVSCWSTLRGPTISCGVSTDGSRSG